MLCQMTQYTYTRHKVSKHAFCDCKCTVLPLFPCFFTVSCSVICCYK